MSEKGCSKIKAENQLESSDKGNHQQNADKDDPPAIFQLNIDCFNKLFDYLSRKDLYSISQTCKSLKQIAGEFFRSNYESSEEFIKCQEFNQFVSKLVIPTYNELMQPANDDDEKCNQILKQVRFLRMELSDVELNRVEKMLQHAEAVIIDDCTVKPIFYFEFPKMCPNLKRLHVHRTTLHYNTSKRNANESIFWQFPALEHLEWISTNGDELKIFFEQNPNVRSFTTNANNLWESRDLFLECQVQLDDLSIEMGAPTEEPQTTGQTFKLLKELHKRGSFKRLHLDLKCFSQQTLEQMELLGNALLALSSLRLKECTSESITLPQLINLKELNISTCLNDLPLGAMTDVNALVSQLVNLERIHFAIADDYEITQFICHSAKLKKMKIENLAWQDDNNVCIDLLMLNNERAKLPQAQKLIIYIGDEEYLATKWSCKQTEFNCIEMRRAMSNEWGQHFPQNWESIY